MTCRPKTNIILKSLLICSLVFMMQSIAARADSLHRNLIIFGDSLSDSANPTTNNPGYAIEPRVWGQYLVLDKQSFLDSGQLKTSGMTPLDLNNDNINYATGGATAIPSSAACPGSAPTFSSACLDGQVDQYLALVGSAVISPNTDIIIWIGGNDLFANRDPGNITATISTEVTRIKNQETASTTVPYKIYLINLAPLGGIPMFNGNPTAQSAYNAATAAFDSALASVATALSDASHQVTLIDMSSVSNTIVANPEQFGLNEPTPSSSGAKEFKDCMDNPPSSEPNQCEGYLFYDKIHPTTAVHAIIAQVVGQAVFPLPTSES